MKDISIDGKYDLSPAEPAFLRFFDINDIDDIEAYRLVDIEPEVRFWMDEDPIETDIEIIKHLGNVSEFLIMAICSKKDLRIIGWLQFTYDDPYHITQLNEAENRFRYCTDIIEISYARHTKSSDVTKGFISSAVRQACYIFNESFKHAFPGKKLMLTAYTDVENLPSERVLEKSFFTKVDEVFYYEDEPDLKDKLWVLDTEKLDNNFSDVSKILLPESVIKQFVGS